MLSINYYIVRECQKNYYKNTLSCIDTFVKLDNQYYI